MRTTDKVFFLHSLNTDIAEMHQAAELFAQERTAEAEETFAAYIKKALRDKRFNTLPISLPEGTGGVDLSTFAEEVLEGTVVSIGFKYRFPDGIIDWTHNPTFNKYCEFSYHLQYHNELLALALEYEKTADERFARRFDVMINSWMKQAICPENESGFGARPLWRTIEAGGRMARTWPYCINAFLDSPSVPARTWANIFRSVCDHGHRLTHNNTRSTHNNWIINEMIGLLTMGLSFPFMKNAGFWVEYALDCMKGELALQILPDGMQVELTTGYHGGIIANYQKAETVLRLFNHPVPEEFDRYIRLMYTMYTQLCRPDLHTPGLNDGGEADVRRSCRNALTRYPEDTELQYFASGRAEGKAPDYLSRILPDGGFAVMRSGWDENAIWAFLDAGPEGLAHQHEDKLAFQLSAYGANMLADTGTYAYDTSDMRRYALSSRSHSTGIVDGMGQNRSKQHKYKYEEYIAERSELTYSFSDDLEIAEGIYAQGYGPDLIPVTHRRRVLYFKKGLKSSLPFFVLYDTFESRDGQPHLCEVSFQLREDPITAQAHRVNVQYKNGAALSIVGSAYPRILIGQYAPEFVGWKPIHSPEEHEHMPAPVVSFAKKGLFAEFATLLFPAPTVSLPAAAISVQDAVITLTLNGTDSVLNMCDSLYTPHIRANG